MLQDDEATGSKYSCNEMLKPCYIAKVNCIVQDTQKASIQ